MKNTAEYVAELQVQLSRSQDREKVLAKQLVTSERELQLMAAEQLKLYRRFHKPAKPSSTCVHCHHRHLSKKHGHRCPDCPCAEGGQ